MLEIKDLFVSYGMMEVLHGISLKVEDKELQKARLKLADSVRSVLANGLNILGVTAPEKM